MHNVRFLGYLGSHMLKDYSGVILIVIYTESVMYV